MRHFLVDDDLSAAEQLAILDLADTLKAEPFSLRPFAGPRTVAVLFDKPSTRTRISFETGDCRAGWPSDDHGCGAVPARPRRVDRATPRECSAACGRNRVAHSGQERLQEMADHADVPVINGLTDQFHPCQVLADLQTIREHKQQLAGLTLAYVGDGANNMAHSYLLGGSLAGMHVRIGAPPGFQPDPEVVDRAAEPGEQLRGQRAGSRGGRGSGGRTRMWSPLTPGSRWVRRTLAVTGRRSSCRMR